MIDLSELLNSFSAVMIWTGVSMMIFIPLFVIGGCGLSTNKYTPLFATLFGVAALALLSLLISATVQERITDEIDQKVNKYIMEEGGLDAMPELDAADAVYELYDNRKKELSEELIFKFEIDGEPHVAALAFALDDKNILSIYMFDGSEDELVPWGAEAAITSGNSGNESIIEKIEKDEETAYLMNKRVAEYIEKTGELDKAPKLDVSSRVEKLTQGEIESFTQKVDLTVNGAVYSTELFFFKNEDGALDVEIVTSGENGNVPLSAEAIVESQQRQKVGDKIMLVEE